MSKKNQPVPAPAAAPVEMSINVAVGNVNNVVRAYKGSKDEHDILTQSMETIADTLNENRTDLEAAESRIAELEASEAELQTELAALKAPEPEPEPAVVEKPIKLQGPHTSRFSRASQSQPNATPKQ
jgi:chromosome segregation ATPase